MLLSNLSAELSNYSFSRVIEMINNNVHAQRFCSCALEVHFYLDKVVRLLVMPSLFVIRYCADGR